MAFRQIPLNLRLRADATFDNFVDKGNESVVHALCQSDESYVYLWGEQGCGKSHLLQALCHQQGLEKKAAAYIPLADDDISEPEVLLGLEEMDLVCIDDIQQVCGLHEWEVALFNFFNAMREKKARLVIAASATPAALNIKLADLVSRLNWGVMFALNTLRDEDKIAALQTRAEQLGMSLSQDVADYLLKRSPRDMASLFNLLNKLDTASLTEQRRLTIPFVRQYL